MLFTLNLYVFVCSSGEADHQAVLEVQATKVSEWDSIVKNYMASRLQYMFRRRKGNKWRQKSMFKLMNAVLKAKTDQQRYCVRFMERSFAAYKVRLIFRRQLRYAFEKIYDVDSGKLFWYNCITGEASWDRPYILGRCLFGVTLWAFAVLEMVLIFIHQPAVAQGGMRM